MRAKRCVRVITRSALLLVLTVTALMAPPPPLFAAGSPVADATVPTVGRAWPVGLRPRVLRAWEPPATVYGPGHRGVDLAAPPGAPVRAVAAGRVAFAGRVAGKGVVSVDLTETGDPPLRTTYEPVTATVKEGADVAPGEVIGTVDARGSHCTGTCVHWGLRRGETYLNPLSLLPPWLLHRGPSRLLPVYGPVQLRTVALPGRAGSARLERSGEPGEGGRSGTRPRLAAHRPGGLNPAHPAAPSTQPPV